MSLRAPQYTNADLVEVVGGGGRRPIRAAESRIGTRPENLWPPLARSKRVRATLFPW